MESKYTLFKLSQIKLPNSEQQKLLSSSHHLLPHKGIKPCLCAMRLPYSSGEFTTTSIKGLSINNQERFFFSSIAFTILAVPANK